MNHYLALTIIADDRPGIVEKVADIVTSHDGNWLESNMSRLAGKFAGILLVDIAENKQSELLDALNTLDSHGIRISAETSQKIELTRREYLNLSVVGNDRPGIVGELSSLLAKFDVNVEELSTHCEDAPMSAETLFRATASLSLPENGISKEQLAEALEALSDDLMVEFESEQLTP